MAELNEHVAYLSQEIGPRPAGTEEEQRAALYISEQFSAEAGLTTAMEDFQCNPDSSLPRTLCSGVAVLVTLVATIVGALAVPAIVVSLICAALAAAEVFDKPVLSRLLNRGVSQNVVARYLPAKSPTRASRRRKVIVVANYDSGKVRRDLNGAMPAVLPILYWVELAMLVVMPLLLAIRMVLAPDGTVLVVFNVLLAVAMVVAVLPVASFLLEKFANYNEGANCNAAGVAVLLEVASRVAAARDLPDAPEPTVHGEAAAVSAGLVPEGAEIVYHTGNTSEDLGTSMESAAERLAAAKAAVAALSGKPVSATSAEVATEDESPAKGEENGAVEVSPEESLAPSSAAAVVPVAAPAYVAPAEHQVPEWFKKGQEQAKKPAKEKPVQRSRYATALERAEEEINAREEHERRNLDELSERMRVMRASVQAASAAAGATPTEIMDSVVADESSDEISASPSTSAVNEETSPSAAPVLPAIEVPAVEADQLPSPSNNTVSAMLADIPAIASEPASSEAGTSASKPVVPAVPAVPVVPQPTDDPDVTVRDVQRPLTGATVAVPPIDLSTPDAPAAPAGGQRVVVHVGAAMKMERSKALTNCRAGLIEAYRRLDDIGLEQTILCPETMGKYSQIGDLRETLDVCLLDERMLPCIDFAHLHALGGGSLNTQADFAAVLDTIESVLGLERARKMHMHFSTIEYTVAGEKRHHTFAEEKYGPRFENLAPLLYARGYDGTVICESKGTQADDAMAMRRIWQAQA